MTKFFRCDLCGNLIGMIDNKGVSIVCCGQNMTELVPNTVDASREKHLPVVTLGCYDCGECACGCGCGPDCDCGCQEGKECTCGCDGGCGDGCGCQEGHDCGCGDECGCQDHECECGCDCGCEDHDCDGGCGDDDCECGCGCEDECCDCGFTVTIGSELHPQTPEHHISFVYVQTENGGRRKNLPIDGEPRVSFCCCDDEPVAIYAYCNIHGLWKVEL